MAKGHQLSLVGSWGSGTDEVLSVCVTKEKKVILTGHESRLIAWRQELTDGVLIPPVVQSTDAAVSGSVMCIRQFPRLSKLAVSCNQSILLFEYALTDGHYSSLKQTDQYCFSKDEINSLDIHAKETYICTCDDDGEIKIIDLDNKCLLRTLSNFHDVVCSSVKFIPRRPWEVISGGLDSKLGRWDFRRGKLLARVDIGEGGGEDMMINPPMVHSLTVIQSQNCVACGLGNGKVSVYALRGPKGLDMVTECKVHSCSVACVASFEVDVDQSKAFVVSAGNDGILCVHVLESSGHGDGITLRIVDKLEGITKVNDMAVTANGNRLTIYTADVTGTVSLYDYVI